MEEQHAVTSDAAACCVLFDLVVQLGLVQASSGLSDRFDHDRPGETEESKTSGRKQRECVGCI